jgi:hypothetical protein
MAADAVDAALARIHTTDLEYASGRTDGLASHAPMVVGSLDEAGRSDRIEPFLKAYLPRLRPMPPLVDATIRLGDPTTRRAWVHHYEVQLLSATDWRVVTQDAVRELLPGAIAGAAHGWLRTAHAIYLLARRDTEARRRELAHGLASWAARFERLPGRPGVRPVLGLDPAGTLASVPVLAASKRRDAFLLFERTRAVADLPGFAAAVEAADLDALEVEEAIGALAAACARAFLASPESGRFAYLHTITATSALRLALPALDEESRRQTLGAVFQVVAALHATNAAERTSVAPVSVRPVTREAIAGWIGETLDDHDVKIIVAALREGTPEVMAAAGGWVGI